MRKKYEILVFAAMAACCLIFAWMLGSTGLMETRDMSGTVLESRASDQASAFQHVVVDLGDNGVFFNLWEKAFYAKLDDIVIIAMTEKAYYAAGQPAVGDVCQIQRAAYYAFPVGYRYDVLECAPPPLGME
jgi:hypothetical protein